MRPDPNSPVRLEDVAQAAGVSTITVSRCITNPDRVAERTRTRVLQLANEMGYIPNRLAKSLVSAQSRIIGAVVPTMANPIHSEALQGAFDQLKGAGYQILLGTSGYSADDERSLVETFIGHRVDGLLLTGGDHRAETVKAIRQSGTPTVEIFEFIPEPIDLNVGSSQWDAGYALGSHLVGKGYRNFAFVGHSDVEDTRIASRREGIAAVCLESELSAPRNYATSSDPGSGGGGEIIGAILRDAPEIDVVIFAGHQIAVGAIRHAADVGIDVPGRVAIAGFGDSAMARWIRPALTTVRFPVRDMGAEAGKLLLGRLQGREIQTRAVRLGFEILERGSA